jgi:hypothetical protein
MTEHRFLIALSVLALAGASSAIASAQTPAPAGQNTALSDEGKLERVKGLYRAEKYAECASAFAELLDPKAPGLSDRDVIESARIWNAVCLLANGQKARADESLRKAIDANKLMATPDNLTYPPDVIDEFLLVKDTMRAEIDKAEAERRAADQKRKNAEQARIQKERERLRQLVDLAGTETITRVNRRWIAAVPFGVGQFQNRQDALGWLFLTSETLLAGTALTSVYVRTKIDADLVELKGKDGQAVQDANNLRATWHAVSLISGWGLVAVAAAGVAHAELTFVPEFRITKRRKLSPELERLPDRVGRGGTELRPEVAVVPGGASFGLKMTF